MNNLIRVAALAAVAIGSIGASQASVSVLVRGSCVDAPPLGNGWGWNGRNTCFVNSKNSTGTLLIASSGNCIDTIPLNDGYGWTGSSSCALAPLDESAPETPPVVANSIRVNINGSCVDAPPLDNGWGWNGRRACNVSSSNRTGTMLIAARGNCIDTLPLNDGYGWTGTASCDLPPINNPIIVDDPVVDEPVVDDPIVDEPVIDDPVVDDPIVDVPDDRPTGDWWQPKASDNLTWQIQLQGDIRIRNGVDVYAVDSDVSQASINAAKATGAKIMCYISAGSAENWRDDYNQIPRVAIGNAYDGWPGEWWLDTSNIAALAPIMRARMDVCKARGFDVIDPDNVNGFENNTGFNISRAESIAYIRWLADEAHQRGMAFSLKNSETLVADLLDDVDMMQSESCYRWGNCANAGRLSAVDKPVFAVEYQESISQARFRDSACVLASRYNMSMVFRDVLLTANGVYESCN